MNAKLKDLKGQYELRTSGLYQVIEQLKQEVMEQKSRVHNLSVKTKHVENVEWLVRKAFQLEQNPYRFWKLLQDFKGNEFWLEVFEKQRPSFGINYREINQLLMASKAYEREFRHYKDALDQQMLSLVDGLRREAEKCKAEVSRKEQVSAWRLMARSWTR